MIRNDINSDFEGKANHQCRTSLTGATSIMLIFVSVLYYATATAQADIHFSQFYETSILRNPALTGVFSDNYKFSAFYRNQWSSITYPYQTLQLSTEYRFALGRSSYDFLSFGVLGYQDEAGDLNQKITGIYPAINFNKQLDQRNNSYLSFGFTGGYIQYSFDPAKATFNNQFQNGLFSPSNPTFENLPVPNMAFTDVGAGINFNISPGALNSVTYMIGAAGYHFSQPVFSYYRDYKIIQYVRWNVNAAMIRELNDNVLLQLHGNFAKQGTYTEIIAGCLVGYRSFSAFEEAVYTFYAGLFYRYQDAIIPTVKLKYKSLSIGLSYDVNVSTLTPASNAEGGLEITAIVSGTYPKNKGYDKKTPCPRF
jgi:type IX secretion system PorP/SprF family membrane protein